MTEAKIFLRVALDASTVEGNDLDLKTFKEAATEAVETALQRAEDNGFNHCHMGKVSLLFDYAKVTDTDPA